MELLYGTTNPGKLQSMREVLDGLEIKIIGLKDLNLHIEEVDESGNEPLQNAVIKAKAYYDAFKRPVFSCDSGLYIEGVSDEKQPGVHVRRVNGKALNDEEMINYYSNLAAEFGGNVKAKYKNSICLILDDKTMFKYDGEEIASDKFIITSKQCKKRIAGFPLDSISVDIKSGQYYVEVENNDDEDKKVENGFRNFFMRCGIV